MDFGYLADAVLPTILPTVASDSSKICVVARNAAAIPASRLVPSLA
jgi:hypothetical protein